VKGELLAKASEEVCCDRLLQGREDVEDGLTNPDELHLAFDVDVCWPRTERGDHWAGQWEAKDEQELGDAWERKFVLRNGGALAEQEAQVTTEGSEVAETVAEFWTLNE
jgi:hypothetical protein